MARVPIGNGGGSLEYDESIGFYLKRKEEHIGRRYNVRQAYNFRKSRPDIKASAIVIQLTDIYEMSKAKYDRGELEKALECI